MTKTILGVLLIALSFGIFGKACVQSIQFQQNCYGFLKRAADANTVETAKTELGKTINYLESHGLTTGYTSALYQTQDEDIAFWYNNLKSSYAELNKITDATPQLEKTNVLMKLRETLLDHSRDGDVVTFPDGISRFPHNSIWLVLFSVALLALVGGCIFGAALLFEWTE